MSRVCVGWPGGEEFPLAFPHQQRMDDQINSLAPRLRQSDQDHRKPWGPLAEILAAENRLDESHSEQGERGNRRLVAGSVGGDQMADIQILTSYHTLVMRPWASYTISPSQFLHLKNEDDNSGLALRGLHNFNMLICTQYLLWYPACSKHTVWAHYGYFCCYNPRVPDWEVPLFTEERG